MDSFFNPQPELSSPVLEVRPLHSDDLEALYLVASAREIWEGHPVKDRHEREVFGPYAQKLLEIGTALVVIDRQTEKIIGCSRYYVSADQPQSICVGFTFLHHSYWGGKTNLELKRLMLGHAFQNFDEVWFHIAPSNFRSQRATLRLGAQYMGDAFIDLFGGPTLWMCFRLSRRIWEEHITSKMQDSEAT